MRGPSTGSSEVDGRAFRVYTHSSLHDADAKEDREMGIKNQAVRAIGPAVLACLLLAASCAGVQDVRVSYRLPEPGSALDGGTVFIDFQDDREDRDILTPAAREEYRYHSGNVALFVSRGEGEPSAEGLKNVPALFRDVISMRIRRLGGEVVSLERQAEATLVIALEAFRLDLEDRTWKGRMAYELRVKREGRVRARQDVAGEAERVKIIGLKQADRLMGELFTDVVNRPDLGALFRKAGLR